MSAIVFNCRRASIALGYELMFANLTGYAVAQATDARGITIPELDRAVTWRELEALARLWSGSVIVKGVMHPDVARRAAEGGAQAIVVSNHRGRQFDAAPATLDALRDIRVRAPAGLELFIDGGVASGLDVLKYIQAGANACLVGRAIVYGLGAAGEAGAAAALRILDEGRDCDGSRGRHNAARARSRRSKNSAKAAANAYRLKPSEMPEQLTLRMSRSSAF